MLPEHNRELNWLANVLNRPLKNDPLKNDSLKIVVLISGNGSNLQSIIDAIDSGNCDAKIVRVISNNPDAYGLQRAASHGLPTSCLDHHEYQCREAYDQALLELLQSQNYDFLVLAGFMRILSSAFIQANSYKIVNIHPSILPSYKGLRTHSRAMQNNEKEHGVSIHVVTAELDDGPILLRGRYPIHATDSLDDLHQRGHQLEHKMYPQVIQWLSEGRLSIKPDNIFFDGKALSEPLEYSGESAA